MIFDRLKQFRKCVYALMGRSQDSLFELMDAVLTSPHLSSFVQASQNPLFRREWSSVYSGLKCCRLPRAQLMKQVLKQIPIDRPVLLAGDTTVWPRPDAVTLKERTFERGKGGSIQLGQSYSTIAWVPEMEGSWALPLRHERVTSFETPVSRAAFQLKQVCRELSIRPVVAYDRAYGNAPFVKATATVAADLLIRLPGNRCVWGAPPPYSGRGAPRKHGVKFKFNAPESWPIASAIIEIEDPKVGRVRVSRWCGYHFRGAPQRHMDIIRVEVMVPKGRRRQFKPLWLAWVGEGGPTLDQLWVHYLRRFALEHWYRLSKQRLYWTLPQLTNQHAIDAWSLLVVLMSWQLWLARDECPDTPLPWQSAQETLSPGRVAQAFGVIVAAIGTPAQAPKPRGKSPGWTPGHPRTPKARYPSIKKRASKRKKTKHSKQTVA
ncbi:MAG: NF041680 family putative transposase [Cyanobacteria bacterium P01_G01_bin.54]